MFAETSAGMTIVWADMDLVVRGPDQGGHGGYPPFFLAAAERHLCRDAITTVALAASGMSTGS